MAHCELSGIAYLSAEKIIFDQLIQSLLANRSSHLWVNKVSFLFHRRQPIAKWDNDAPSDLQLLQTPPG